MAENEKLRIEYIRLDKAIELLWPENPKMHHLQALAKSFETHGFRDAPAFDEKLAEGGAIVDGNGRIEALWWMYNESQTNDEVKPPRGIALDDGMWCLPVQFGINAASKAAAESYAIDANNLTMAGGEFTAFDMARMWDDEKYLAVLAETAAADVMPASVDLEDLEALYRGFGAETMAEAPEPQLDKAAELQEKWQVKKGQIWECGEHRIACGDCTSSEDIKRLMDGALASSIVTDPPYGQEQEGVFGDSFSAMTKTIKQAIPLLPIENAVIAAFQSPRTFHVWLNTLLANGFRFERALWLYKEAQETFPWRGWILKSEMILLASKGKGQWVEIKPFTHDCYKIPEVSYRTEGIAASKPHGSIKPLTVVSDILQRITPLYKIVFDGFCGTGTSIVASEMTNRKGYGIEIEPKNVAISLQRLADMGLEPHLVDEIST